MLRDELTQVRSIVDQVKKMTIDVGSARSSLNEMTMKQNNWTLGAYCSRYCATVTQHHGLEDASVFPHLRAAETTLAPVLDRLEQEHVVIHDVIEAVDRALVAFVATPDDFSQLDEAVNALTDTLLSHLSYEEEQLVEPLARVGFYPGQA
ncbi:hemerythrin domain-containing protein [Ornithinimicrobium cryptoxanthini]|uniref:Hemerythrin domain-containing protein n=2 Tax=Ornithinimicrobium cryptoxanthini TaxID=2934161 RepID=A0ABY4YMN8_9MICO|nr:hemerythrin domain-containing protein [Ornithinimicrobium cryptoxanthini]